MIESNRKEILERLFRISEMMPDMRFGQTIANLTYMATLAPWPDALWDMEDEQLLEAVRQFESDLQSREKSIAAA